MKVFRPMDFLYHIAVAALQKAEDLDSRDKKNPKEWGNNQEFEMKSARVTAVAFSALCLEAVVHHVLASHKMRIPKGKKARKQKGRTYLEFAWLELPSLFGGERFDENKPPYKVFKELVDIRNDNTLFHNRPKKARRKSDAPYLDDLAENASLARRYVRCVEDMLEELDRLTSGKVMLDGRTIRQFLLEQPHLYRITSS